MKIVSSSIDLSKIDIIMTTKEGLIMKKDNCYTEKEKELKKVIWYLINQIHDVLILGYISRTIQRYL